MKSSPLLSLCCLCLLAAICCPGSAHAQIRATAAKNAIDGRYVWLPIVLEGDRFTMPWRASWDLSYLRGEIT